RSPAPVARHATVGSSIPSSAPAAALTFAAPRRVKRDAGGRVSNPLHKVTCGCERAAERSRIEPRSVLVVEDGRCHLHGGRTAGRAHAPRRPHPATPTRAQRESNRALEPGA